MMRPPEAENLFSCRPTWISKPKSARLASAEITIFPMLTGKPPSLCSPSTPKLFAVRKGALVCRTNPSNLIPLKWASFFAS